MRASVVACVLASVRGEPLACTFEDNTDFNGNDLKPGGDSHPTNTSAACCTMCADTAGCNAFTFMPAASLCFLKSSDAGRRGMSTYTSGKPPAVPTPPPTPWSCHTDDDCSLNGVCSGGTCACDKPWGGVDCALLQFDPAPVTECGKGCIYHGGASANTSWGGSILRGDDSKYYMAVAEMADGCSLGQWQTNSQVAIAVSDTPEGPYTKESTAILPWAHNPQIVRAADGTYLIYTLGGGPTDRIHGQPVKCYTAEAEGEGDGKPESVGFAGSGNDAARRHRHSHAPVRESTGDVSVSFIIHYSKSLQGPWLAHTATIPNFRSDDNMENWNPAPVVMDDGTVRIMVHTDPQPWAGEVIVQADTWQGPYTRITGDVTGYCDHCQEDPFMWRDKRGHWHALLHLMFDPAGGGPVPSPGWPGGHVFSRDGLKWSGSIQRCYSTNVSLVGGGQLVTKRRERPKLLFNASGHPTHLTNGVITSEGGSGVYTLIAPLSYN